MKKSLILDTLTNKLLDLGLVIVKAWYGHLENLDNEIDEGVIDVTTVIQTLVYESRLTIPGGHSKVNLPQSIHFL